MLTEREIEEKLKSIFATLFQNATTQPRMVGAWDVAEDGEIKGQGDSAASVIAVSVGLRSYASFCTPQADIPCAVVLSIRRDAAPTGAVLAEYIEPLMNLMHIWNDNCDRMCEDLTTDTFNPGGFQLTGGNLQQADYGWTVNISFILRGIVHVAEG